MCNIMYILVKWVFQDPNDGKNIVLFRFGPDGEMDSTQVRYLCKVAI